MIIGNPIYSNAGEGGGTPAISTFTYTGTWAWKDEDQTVLALLSSGVLTFEKDFTADVFLVGGGGGGTGSAQTSDNGSATSFSVPGLDALSVNGGIGGVSTSGGRRGQGGAGGSGGSGACSTGAGNVGGSDGGNGITGTYNGASGGAGQGTTTRAFGDPDGELYAGGGGSCGGNMEFGGAGGAGGGGKGADGTQSGATYGENGQANTGGGGGGGTSPGNWWAGGGGGGYTGTYRISIPANQGITATIGAGGQPWAGRGLGGSGVILIRAA